MPRPRTPIAKAELTGAKANHPERFRNRANPQSLGPVGKPPAFLTAKEKAVWRDFASRWSWLTAEDEPALVVLAQMQAEMQDPMVVKSAAMRNNYRLMISEFGGTPVKRSAVSTAPEDDGDDPFAKFARAN